MRNGGEDVRADPGGAGSDFGCCQARSNRSAFITLAHAATKSCTNFSFASSLAYTSARARSSEFDPKTRSARLPVHLSSPVAAARPSNVFASPDVGFHVV